VSPQPPSGVARFRDTLAFMVFPIFSLPLEPLVPWLIQYRYLFLFPILVVEGPIITIIAGFLVSLGYLDFTATYLLAVTADLVGDTLYYVAGRIGTNCFLDRWTTRLRNVWDQIEGLRSHFERHVGKTLLMGKLTHGAGGLILLTAGAVRIPFAAFFWFNLLGTLPKSLLLLLLGYYFGHSYRRIGMYLDEIALITTSLVLLAGVAFLVYGTRWTKKV
jgi:membrane protein DedA with SNARE-associated domain